MTTKKGSDKYIKFAVYLVVVVLINMAAASLFFRWDLTKNGVYSLSEVSRQVVSTLQEPLTVKVFFTQDLPSPYNGIERYLRDLLEEYAVRGNRYFSYQFYDVSPQADTGAATENQEMASSYGIQPMQIQQLENDEFKSKLAYMGLVIIHGDLVEKIPTITATDGLEYTLTTTIQKANNKISALLGLSEDIQVQLMLSPTLKTVGPLFGLEGISEIPDAVQSAVESLNPTLYDRLTYSYSTPDTDEEQETLAEQYNLMRLGWPQIAAQDIPAGSGIIGLVMRYKDKTVSLPILQEIRIPIFGTQYQLATDQEISEMISAEVESLVNINENIGYLADHGTLTLSASSSAAAMMGLDSTGDLTTFGDLLGSTYNIQELNLADESVPPELQCLIIPRPTEPFSDWELFQIDQALMRGTNLAIFLEPFKEVTTQEMSYMGYQNQVSYESLDTGLEKLLDHWGITVGKSIVMDESCYTQSYSQSMASGQQAIYYAPIIKPENINQSLPMMHNIKEFLALKASPLTLDQEKLGENGLTASVVFSSSDRAWEMEAPIDLNPLYHTPPGSDDEFEQKPLACLVEGSFPSYFAGKELPEKPATEEESEENDGITEESLVDAAPDTSLTAQVTSEGGIIETGKPARVFLLGTGEMLRDDLLDDEGTTPNSMLVMNIIDTLNGHEDIALMRSKSQSHNPLDETGALVKTVVKTINIAGLPLLVVLFGLLVWMRRHVRRKSIQRMFDTV
jgi:ABC-type uncharacterized transport system involved in gliding motility auxiliary subunit